jgi:hypothetical protein
MIRAVAAGLLAAALVAGGAVGAHAAAVAEPPTGVPQDGDATGGRGYPGDPVEEARLVAAEERRLIDIEASISSATAAGVAPTRPFRMTTTGVPTVVLVARTSAYSLEELARIAPRSVAVQGDGSYLVNEHLYVADGATLRLTGDGLRVLLASSADGFASIVGDGGNLQIEGGSGTPVSISSWDGDGPDLVTADGRAYIREHGGHASIVNAEFSDLGFWSGITGGLSLTGTVIPEPLLADDLGSAASPAEPVEVAGIEGSEALGGEGLETLALDSGLTIDGYASALIQSVTVTGCAFGLFVTNSDRVDIRGSHFADSFVDGLVFHRDVTNTTVTSTSAIGNAQDGFNLTRATSGVVFDGLTARSNGRNGITIEGRSLVDGPSATGIATTVYGDNEVRNSISTDNGRYGIEVVGGRDVLVVGNEVARNAMGIVVTSGATGVTVRDNDVSASASQGIALREAGLDAVVTDNTVDGAAIGIFARDAGGAFEDNTVTDVSNHGIALVGETGSSTIVGNTVAGSGPSAIDVYRTSGVAVRDNDIADWRSTKPISVVLRAVFQPLTVLWIVIAVAILGSALFARRLRGPRDPFADYAPLATFTRGIVSRDEVAAPTPAASTVSNERELVGAGAS